MSTGIKTGGRTAGTPNQITKVHREMIQSLFHRQLASGRIERELQKLSGKEYLGFMLKLMAFVVPKLEPVNINGGIASESQWDKHERITGGGQQGSGQYGMHRAGATQGIAERSWEMLDDKEEVEEEEFEMQNDMEKEEDRESVDRGVNKKQGEASKTTIYKNDDEFGDGPLSYNRRYLRDDIVQT